MTACREHLEKRGESRAGGVVYCCVVVRKKLHKKNRRTEISFDLIFGRVDSIYTRYAFRGIHKHSIHTQTST